MQKTIKAIFTNETLRMKVLIVLGLLLLTRLLATIPLPGVDTAKLQDFLSQNQLFEYLALFSGSGFSNFSIVLMGLGSYITASILIQVASFIYKPIKQMMHEEGEVGRKKITQWTRALTVPFTFLQGFTLMKILENQGIITNPNLYNTLLNLLVITAGTMILLWIGEKISEQGVGNGISLIIFSGIAAGLPAKFSNIYSLFDVAQLPFYIAMLILGILIIALVVWISEAERKLPITSARAYGQGQTENSYLPLKLNSAGMIPVIFALAMFTMPQFFAQAFVTSGNEIIKSVATSINWFFGNAWLYPLVYFALVFVFTYFYTTVVVEPKEIAKNLHKRGAYIPGVRPGENTEEYIGKVVSRITFVGALFLGVIAVLPLIIQSLSGITTIAVGGTSVLIVVSTAIETYKKLSSQATLIEY
jgi:preprotein translocase subunit SecY